MINRRYRNPKKKQNNETDNTAYLKKHCNFRMILPEPTSPQLISPNSPTPWQTDYASSYQASSSRCSSTHLNVPNRISTPNLIVKLTEIRAGAAPVEEQSIRCSDLHQKAGENARGLLDGFQQQKKKKIRIVEGVWQADAGTQFLEHHKFIESQTQPSRESSQH